MPVDSMSKSDKLEILYEMKTILNFLKPYVMVDSIFDSEIVINSCANIKLIFMDVDNTIISYRENEIHSSIQCWLDDISTQKRIVFVTNNKKQRVDRIAYLKKFNCVCKARKPCPLVYKKILKKNHVLKNESVIIGDQLFNDVLGGKLASIKTILVKPIDKEMTLRMRVKRSLESMLLKYMENLHE